MRSSWSVAAVLAVALTVSACAKKKVAAPDTPTATPPPAAEPARPTPPPAPPPAPQPAAPSTPLTEEEIFAKTPIEELQKNLSDVFFAFDSVELSDEGRAALQKNLQWLNRWKTVKLMIEGHTDSRGTNEYNLALAERRGDVARDYLVSLGLAADRVTVVSKGEEQPFCAEETEACWQENRRAHFIITAK